MENWTFWTILEIIMELLEAIKIRIDDNYLCTLKLNLEGL